MSTFAGNAVLLDDDVVLFGYLRFWAERGLIHIEDSRDNSYECVSVKTILHRMRAISDMLGNSSSRETRSEDQFDQNNRKRHQDMLDAMCQMVKRAQIQGMPSDPTASRDLARRRPKTIVVPGVGECM